MVYFKVLKFLGHFTEFAEPIGIQSEEAGRICFLEKEEIRRARYHFSQGG